MQKEANEIEINGPTLPSFRILITNTIDKQTVLKIYRRNVLVASSEDNVMCLLW